ncbi:MAG TPA: histidine kinase dimerization/phospho-acceptor domain-containing protein, partial [Phenylobacterium sp.]|nr:histidine kinase dimerization/phospho-acceptor domain-containing protein [Phenylobacterium sp.]
MASVKTPTPSGPATGLDRQSPVQAQDELAWDMRGAGHGRLRMRTLVTLRWTLILGEVAILLIGGVFLGFKAPYAICFGLIGVAAWINLLTGVASPGQRMMADWEATAQLGFDIAQISILLFLTGGAANPFILMLIAPITLAAATVRQAAQESIRMALALDVTQTVLSREQRLSALGALAAAAAHELGTPLATIAIVAKELAREAPTPQVKEDADLLIAQAARCREILRRLTDAPAEASD